MICHKRLNIELEKQRDSPSVMGLPDSVFFTVCCLQEIAAAGIGASSDHYFFSHKGGSVSTRFLLSGENQTPSFLRGVDPEFFVVRYA